MRDPMPSTDLLKDIPDFTGFSREARKFFVALGIHNDRHWFEAHRAEYETHVLQPMRAFVVEVGRRLRKKVPKLIADPRVGSSVSRIARDTRFSSDKSPYKSWASAHLRAGRLPGSDMAAGFYFHIDAESVYAGGGIWMFGDDQLERYRKALSNPKSLKALRAILRKLDDLEIGGKYLKRVPRGFLPDHPAADLLLFKGFYAGGELSERHSRTYAIMDDAIEVYERLLPMHKWLMEHVVG